MNPLFELILGKHKGPIMGGDHDIKNSHGWALWNKDLNSRGAHSQMS